MTEPNPFSAVDHAADWGAVGAYCFAAGKGATDTQLGHLINKADPLWRATTPRLAEALDRITEMMGDDWEPGEPYASQIRAAMDLVEYRSRP